MLPWGSIDSKASGLSSIWGCHPHEINAIPAQLSCYFKLCASFHSHQWNPTGVTIRKCPIWVKINDCLSRMTLKLDRWPWKTIKHLFYAISSFVHLLCNFKLCASFHSHQWNQTGVTVRKRPIQVEWWLEHGHGWLVKRQWAGPLLGWVSRDEYQVLGSTSIPARLDTLVYWEPFSWLTSVGTTRNTVIRLWWSRIGLAVLILHAAGVGLRDRPAVICGRYNKYHSLQLQNYYAHFPPLQHTHIHANTIMRNWSWEWSWVSRHCMLTVAGGILCDRVKRPIGH